MLAKIKEVCSSDNGKVLAGNLGASVLGLVTFMLLARILPKSTFGEWAVFSAAAGFADLLRTGLIRQALVRHVTLAEDPGRKLQYQKAAVILHLLSVGLVSAFLLVIAGFFAEKLASPYDQFVVWYPLWMLISIPHMMDTWFSHALQLFGRMNKIRLGINMGMLMFVCIGFYIDFDIQTLIIGQLLIQSTASVFSLIRHADAFLQTRNFSKRYLKELFKFGRHSLATLTGANLLKSADHMIVGVLLGSEAVAIYAIPLKLMDLVEIPVRGFVMTSFQKLSVLASKEDIKGFVGHFYQWSGKLTLLFLPAGLLLLIFPGFFVTFIGGEGYAQSQSLLQVMVISMVLMPLDKYLGMSFDSINSPKRNALKVWVMVVVNIVGDLIVILWLESLLAVAMVTVMTMISGLMAGFIMHPSLHFSPKKLLLYGLQSLLAPFRSVEHPIVDRTIPSTE